MHLTLSTIHTLKYESYLAETMIREIFKHYENLSVQVTDDIDIISEEFARKLFQIVKSGEEDDDDNHHWTS